MNDREKLREQILGVDTVFVMDNTSTEEFLPPNFYIDRLVDCILDWHIKQQEEAKLKARLVELDLLEQAINAGRDIYKFKLQRLADLVQRLATLRKENGERV